MGEATRAKVQTLGGFLVLAPRRAKDEVKAVLSNFSARRRPANNVDADDAAYR